MSIKLSSPALLGREREYVLRALDSNMLSWNGPFVQEFEEAFAQHLGVRHAIATCNGTAALHLALLAAGVGPDDRVLVPTLTYIATANAVSYCGAEPVFGDVDWNTWGLSSSSWHDWALPVHLYGVPSRFSPQWRGIVEDAAEAIGAKDLNGIPSGTVGIAGVFSFYANKILTTGEGGMVVTDHDDVAERVRLLRGQAQSPSRKFWHVEIGYNYRMTNIAAAIGLGQLECLDEHLHFRQEVVEEYKGRLEHTGITWQTPDPNTTAAPWLFTCLLPKGVNRDVVIERLRLKDIETRPVFPCVHTMPMYLTGQYLPRAEEISDRGICLPTHVQLTSADIALVCSSLLHTMRQLEKAS